MGKGYVGCRQHEICAAQKANLGVFSQEFSVSLLPSGGQQLAIRPDLVPPIVLKELQKLCDSVRPIPDEIALQMLKDELQLETLEGIFDNVHLVASASLGQVYQARLAESGALVAIKVQRPGMRRSFSLDLFLLQKWGDVMDWFTSAFTEQTPFHRALFDNFSSGSYSVSRIYRVSICRKRKRSQI